MPSCSLYGRGRRCLSKREKALRKKQAIRDAETRRIRALARPPRKGRARR